MEAITIGILAGMGPRSTGPFLESVLDECQVQYGALYDIDYPHIMIYSLPTPFFINREIDEDALKETIKRGLEKLETCGVDLVAIPCNSAHSYFDYICEQIDVPVLNIVDEAVKDLETSTRVTVIGTEMTMASGLYQEGILKAGSRYVFLEEWQTAVNEVIGLIKKKSPIDFIEEKWHDLLKTILASDVHTVIVACTDLNVVLGAYEGLKFIDSGKTLAQALVRHFLEMKSARSKEETYGIQNSKVVE